MSSQVINITGVTNPAVGGNVIIKASGNAGIITSIDKYAGDALTPVLWAAGIKDTVTLKENNMGIYLDTVTNTWYAIPYAENRLPDLNGTIRGL